MTGGAARWAGLALLAVFVGSGWVQACGLVDHAWAVVAYRERPLAAPPLLAGVVQWLETALGQQPGQPRPRSVVWVPGPGAGWVLPWVTRGLLSGWLGRLPWHLAASGSGVTGLARAAMRGGTPTLFLGTDEVRLRFVWLLDGHSAGRCHQWLLLCESRERAVLAGVPVPWAEEQRLRVAASLVFYRWPLPGQVLMASVQLADHSPWWSFADEGLVGRLLDEGLVRARQVMRNEPFALDLPPLPGDAPVTGRETSGAAPASGVTGLR